MIQKAFDSIEKADIDSLVVDAVNESKTLEYKQQLPGNSDDDKKEFLADLSSFGNASGGDVIFGIRAAVDALGKKTGAPENVLPITGVTADAAKLRLEQIILNTIEPRLRVQIKEIAGWGDEGKGFVILVRIPQSFAAPHMVTFKNWSRFYSRNSAGKYQLDVRELQTAFLATESQMERIKHFRQERLGRILADETPVVLSSAQRLILHVIPLTAFLNNERVVSSSISANIIGNFNPIASGGRDYRFNFDGLMTWSGGDSSENSHGYCQLFNNGIVESVRTDILDSRTQPNHGIIKFIPSTAFERDLIEALYKYFSGLKLLGVIPPVIVLASLLGCKGAYMVTRGGGLSDHSIDRDTVLLPDVATDSFDVEVEVLMKPVFDAVWNACGYRQSFNYDDKGKWEPKS